MAMDTATRFAATFATTQAADDESRALPDQLSRAAAAVLAVDGVGLSLAGEEPVPLGSSGNMPTVAEQLQFTVGVGPCLVAVDTRFPLFAVESYLQRRWPIYHDLLRTLTPYRSVVAYPMSQGLAGVGAMVVYLHDPAGPLAFDSFEAHTVVDLVSGHLTSSATWAMRYQPDLQHWLDTPTARVRTVTWQAVGMISQRLGAPPADALDVLRARAYATGRLVDAIALDLVHGHIRLDDLA